MPTTQQIIPGDCIEGMRTLPDASVHCCVTSPPYYGLRNYGHDGQIGLEDTPEAYVARMVEVFREVRRILREDAVLFLNLGDSYASGKQLVGIPWRVAFALQADGWRLRQDIIWHKPNPMPESVTDRCTKAHEYVFLLAKSERYFYDADAVAEKSEGRTPEPRSFIDGFGHSSPQLSGRGGWDSGTRNRRSVWTITTKPYSGAHFAVMPADLVEPCIKAGCPEQCCPACGKGYERITVKEKSFESGSGRSGNAIEGKQDLSATETNSTPDIRMGPVVSVTTLGWQPACDCAASGTIPGTVLDPFAGSGTTLAVAAEQGRSGIGCELNPEYIALAKKRIREARESVALFDGIACRTLRG